MISLAPAPPPLLAASERFAPASDALGAARALLRRVDTKFVLSSSVATAMVGEILDDYAALTVPAGNVASYQSLYFDTPDRVCFHDHRRGRRIRHKIRIRHYPDRALSFLEIKTKRNEQVTLKHRLDLPYGEERLGATALGFLRARVGLDVDALRPAMRIDFRRVSLLGLAANERVTLDLELTAEDLAGQRWAFGDHVVVEIKQAPFCVRTPVMRALQRAHIRARSLSKYTIATAAMYPELRRNRLLPELRAIQREQA